MNDLSQRGQRAVANWVLLGVVMLLIQVVLGGITRLTGSGLSITEWNIVTHTIPPLTEQRWLEEFDKYRQTPQYQLLNSDFTLSNFKFIYIYIHIRSFVRSFLNFNTYYSLFNRFEIGLSVIIIMFFF